MPSRLTAAASSATDAAIHRKMFILGLPRMLALHPLDLASSTRTLIILNEEMNNIMKILKSLQESSLLIKGASETIKNEVKEQKGGFLSMFLGTLGVSLFGNLLTGKDTIRAGEGTIRAGVDF